MPSNDEIINKAVERVIDTGEDIDLLLVSEPSSEISDSHPDYGMNYTYLYIGMSGQKFVDKMNQNLEATDAQFASHNSAINLRIKSNQIKELKEEDGVIYYTSDGETWEAVISSWGKIQGDITKQKDLQKALLAKADNVDLQKLVDLVQLEGNTITVLQSDLNTLKDTVNYIIQQISGASGILFRLDSIETTLREKISSPDVLQIKEVAGALQYTLDGDTWKPVSTVGIVEWGDIVGNINQQTDLLNKFNSVDDRITEVENFTESTKKTLEDELSEHESKSDNPHNVTKDQIGVHLYTLSQYESSSKQYMDLYIVDDNYNDDKRYTLTFDFNGGTYNGETTYLYKYGYSATVTLSNIITSTPVYSGHTFVGFKESLESSTIYKLSDLYILPNSNSILYAVWE